MLTSCPLLWIEGGNHECLSSWKSEKRKSNTKSLEQKIETCISYRITLTVSRCHVWSKWGGFSTLEKTPRRCSWQECHDNNSPSSVTRERICEVAERFFFSFCSWNQRLINRMDVLRRAYFQETRFASQRVSLCLFPLSLVTSSVTSMIVILQRQALKENNAWEESVSQTTASDAKNLKGTNVVVIIIGILERDRDRQRRLYWSWCCPPVSSWKRYPWMQVKQVSHLHKLKRSIYGHDFLITLSHSKRSEWKCPQDVKSSKVFIVRERERREEREKDKEERVMFD